MSPSSTTPVALVILDGWGLRSATAGNAVAAAATPCMDRLWQAYPHTQIAASGEDVGLPAGQMGNSEVGHLNLGAGRIVYQELTRITKAIQEGQLAENQVLTEACAATVQAQSRLHLMGLLSDGGVHSHQQHLYGLIDFARGQGVAHICLHLFTDGRDTSPTGGADYVRQLQEYIAPYPNVTIASICGRYYAMDRDQRWDRLEKAYNALTLGQGQPLEDPVAALRQAYEQDETDEFLQPRVLHSQGQPRATIDDRDSIIFFNFRADRARQLTRAFVDKDFNGFQRQKQPQLSRFVCLTEYDKTIEAPVAFPPETYPQLFAEVVSKAGLSQLHIAETEKYAHVTFFFNGGQEEAYPQEDRQLIPSPQEVATYDQKPQMSAYEVTQAIEADLAAGGHDVYIINFANPDMVGHTGIMEAAVTAVETVDTCLCRVVEAVLQAGGRLLVTADHGNSEQLLTADGSGPHTAHTTNPVPVVLVDPQRQQAQLHSSGRLADVAPTLLHLLQLSQPTAMTGQSLIAT